MISFIVFLIKRTRKEIFKIHTKGMPLAKDVDIEDLIKKTNGFTGAEISALCREAAMQAMREYKEGKNKALVAKKHFEHALKEIEKTKPKNREVLAK